MTLLDIMPTIIKLEKKTSNNEYDRIKARGGKRSTKLYNTSGWRKLRQSYLLDHPLCEDCLLEGKTTTSEEVHHKIPILSVEDELEQKELLLDYNNLRALCREHHHLIHNNMRKNKRES